MTLVAVYGTLRKGQHNHRWLAGAKLACTGRVNGFTMVDTGYGFPAVYTNPRPTTTGVFVEVYDVDDKTFAKLDRLEGYPNHYNRVQVNTFAGPAWMYTQTTTQLKGKRKIVSGDWLRRS